MSLADIYTQVASDTASVQTILGNIVFEQDDDSTFAGHRLMTPGLASATQHRPAHLLLGQCPLHVTFQMVALILPMAKDCECHWFSPCSG